MPIKLRQAMRIFPRISLLIPLLIIAPLQNACAAQEMKMQDDSWINISGTVVSTSGNAFMLDYGEGVARIEMDDWDWYKEGAAIIDGDKVTVNGRVDKDLYDSKKIEASSVYVKDMNTYFYASAADEEAYRAHFFSPPLVSETSLQLTGTITEISGRAFALSYGQQEALVDTEQMPYNPMDNLGYQKLKEGDRVAVYGEMYSDLFEERELMANAVVTLVEDKRKRNTGIN